MLMLTVGWTSGLFLLNTLPMLIGQRPELVPSRDDLTITSGLLVMVGVEFDLRILAAMLAILGYSLNDTIIIYDRIRENMELRTTADLEEVLNTSVNQTLSRTVLTSITTILALLSLYFLGGEVIQPFAFAMLLELCWQQVPLVVMYI